MGKKLSIILTTLFVGSFLTQPAVCKDYPTKPIEIIAPYTPGSPTDITARLVAEIAQKYLGQPLVVVNKPGAGGSLGAADVISSKPDGYKLYVGINNFFAITVRTQKIPFEPSHLTPLANFSELIAIMCVRGDSPWRTFNDFLVYGRNNPGKLRWAHTGRGLRNHMIGLLIFRKAGVETIDIPYKGTPESSAALLGGHVDAVCITFSTIKDQLRAGKIRGLAAFSDHRFNALPDIPSLIDLGFPEVAKMSGLCGFYIHKDTPEETKKTLFDAFKKASEESEFKKRVEELGDESRFGDAEFLRESIRQTEEISSPILKELGLYIGK